MTMRHNPFRFTRKETVDRLQAVKTLIANKERLAYRAAKVRLLPEGYKPEADESYYAAPKLEDYHVQFLTERAICIASGDWFRDLSFRKLNAVDFVCWDLAGQASIGNVVDIVFYPWERNGDNYINEVPATKLASVWLGTWHHSPIIAWRTAKSPAVKVETLPAYSDLIKL